MVTGGAQSFVIEQALGERQISPIQLNHLGMASQGLGELSESNVYSEEFLYLLNKGGER